MATNQNYQSYLLRCWRDTAEQPWRASLQSTATGQKMAFADLPALLAFLLTQMAVDEDATAAQANAAALHDASSSSYETGEAL